ncbi:6-phosphogluconolactonase [Capsulimonas corticalis]|uniref:6-phosphogluconolactonase n=1 Tax=Capsulimonas corticalis TaxID=2219043 RepID=A0A402CPH8_9BACT|nr:6-phosphogluconolactonase [Capsulimonas corticalis]BDI32994.1 6-phosphogluconolactonase [Capsulimonas corticalis]
MPTVIHFDSKEALSAAAADAIIDAAAQAIAADGRFLFVLAGGSTPEQTYKLLAASERRDRIDWSRTYVFFGDERLVPHDDKRSNYGMAWESLLKDVPLPADHIFPIHTDLPGAEAAQQYADTLTAFFGDGAAPSFHVTLLGLGDDGHTASLFPGMPSLHETKALAVATPPGVLPPPVDRITLTFPVLNASRIALFLIAGESKAAPVQAILETAASVDAYPAAGVTAPGGEVRWMADRAATSKLREDK